MRGGADAQDLSRDVVSASLLAEDADAVMTATPALIGRGPVLVFSRRETIKHDS